MTEVFLISDTHFFHENILTFTRHDGALMRPGFKDANHMNEYIITRWNETVKPEDKVYHLGDVIMGHTAEKFKILGRLNGNKTLILGNHDPKDMGLLRPYFKSVYSSRGLDRFLLTHIPIHPMSLGKSLGNIFGHVHNNIVPGQYGPRYYNVSCEVLDDYKPITFEEVKKRILQQISQIEKLENNEVRLLHEHCQS